MTDQREKQRLAAEAERLLNEPLLVQALDTIMGEAFAEFKQLQINPETVYAVIALQQRIIVLQAIPDLIKSSIYASGQMDGGVRVENKPPADGNPGLN